VPNILHRRELTDHLLTVLQGTNKPVGDAVSPAGGGWDGPPNENGSNFVPYSVLFPGASTVSNGPFCDTQADWQVVYQVSSFGVSRSQCEWMGDLARASIVATQRTLIQLGSDQFRVLQARETLIGPVARMDVVEPSYFGQTDSVTLWMSKEL